MQKKNQVTSEKKPYHLIEYISTYDEMKFGKEVVSAGYTIRIKNEKGNFKFTRLVHNSLKDVTWIDCYEGTSGVYRAFYVDRLKGLVKSKRAPRKKIDVN